MRKRAYAAVEGMALAVLAKDNGTRVESVRIPLAVTRMLVVGLQGLAVACVTSPAFFMMVPET